MVSEAKYQVAFEVMNYQAAASETEVFNLAVDSCNTLPAATTYNIDSLPDASRQATAPMPLLLLADTVKCEYIMF